MKCYHGLPLTPETTCARVMQGRNCMVSFAHPEQIAIATEVCQSVVLDNGAFTTWKRGAAFEGDRYLEWAEFWLRHPAVDWCLIPDVIDGDEQSNAQMVRDWPLPKALSVPVWHLHESLDYLSWLMNAFPRIALGSSGEFSAPGSKRWWSRMAEAMRVICDEDGMPRVKLHGLRMLDPVIFSHLPLNSADSTNVARNIGIDKAWDGPYSPKSRATRAAVMIERIESHASARCWNDAGAGVQQNLSLLG